MAKTEKKTASSKVDIQQLAKNRLQESDLTTEHAKKLKLEVLTAEQTKQLSPNFDARPCIKIPYFTPTGVPSKFYRIRYIGEPTGFEKQAKKKRRYNQPLNTLNEVYLPPLLDCTWASILADPDVPVYITEGEFKAAAGCARDLPVIGLGGVDVFRASKKGFPELLPVLEETKWTGRQVAIIWDSDVGTKPEALSAQRKLAYEITRRGGVPRLLALPPGPDGKKMGLDDYLLVHEPEDLKALVAAAEEYVEAAALWQMNEEVVLILHPPVIVIRESGKLISTKDFSTVHFADRKYTVKQQKSDGDYKSVLKYTAREWMEWPSRYTVESLTYVPGAPQITESGEWNTWKGWGVEPKPGDVTPFLELCDFIFRDQPETRDWFLKWAAYPIQHPGAKLFSAVLIWGVVHGTGKTLLGYTLRDIYGDNSTTIGDQELHASFNEWARDKQFIIGEEITGTDKRQDSNRLKALITQERILINVKYLPVITIPDCINYYFTSNESNALFLQDSDRRVMVHEVRGDPMPRSFYDNYDKWRKNGGAAYVMDYLLKYDLEDFNPKGPALRTSSKEEMIVDNKSELARWCYDLKQEPGRVLAQLGNAKAANECDIYTATQLFNVFNPMNDSRRGTLAALSRELKQAGFSKAGANNNPIQTKLGSQRLWIIRNGEKWAGVKLPEVAAHWEKYWVGGKY